MNAGCAPQCILTTHFANERAKLVGNPWSAYPVARSPTPIPAPIPPSMPNRFFGAHSSVSLDVSLFIFQQPCDPTLPDCSCLSTKEPRSWGYHPPPGRGCFDAWPPQLRFYEKDGVWMTRFKSPAPDANRNSETAHVGSKAAIRDSVLIVKS